LQQATRIVPIVFVNVIDPVGSGFVDSLTRPSGNTTGFLLFEYSLSGKWLELLKLNRAKRDGSLSRCRQSFRERSVRRHPDLGAIARDSGEPINMRDASEIERAAAAVIRAQPRPPRDAVHKMATDWKTTVRPASRAGCVPFAQHSPEKDQRCK